MKTFVVQYKDLSRWDVKYFEVPQYFWDKSFIVPLYEIGKPFQKEVSHQEVKENKFRIISKINFAGELFLREFDEIENYKGKLYLVPPQSLIFSKINARKGCIYFHFGSTPFVVSSEYPVIHIDNKRILGEYLQLALRFGPAKSQLEAVSAGMAKVRTSLFEFLNITIPLLDIKVQESIINYYKDTFSQVNSLLSNSNDLYKEISNIFIEQLNISRKSKIKTKGPFITKYSNISRWDTSFFNSERILHFSNNFISLSEIIDEVSNKNIIPKNNLTYNYIGLENIEKYSGIFIPSCKSGSEIQSNSQQIEDGFIYYSKLRPYLNKAFLSNNKFENLVGSSELFGFKPKKNINYEYVLYFILSEIVLEQVKNLMIGARMPRISEESIMQLKIIIPSDKKQEHIVELIKKYKKISETNKLDGSLKLKNLKKEIHLIILGKKQL